MKREHSEYCGFCGLELQSIDTHFMFVRISYFQKLLGLVLIAIIQCNKHIQAT